VLSLFKNWLSYNRCKLLSRDNTLFELSTKLLSKEILRTYIEPSFLWTFSPQRSKTPGTIGPAGSIT
jgi:hypothetical protein